MTRILKLALLLALVATAFRAAFPQSHDHAGVAAALNGGSLSFEGRGTFGAFVGTTRTLSGQMTGTVVSARGWVEAPVTTLTTRNDRRDRDMRASLEADRFPTMRFDLDSVALAAQHTADSSAVRLHGRLTIHGVTRSVDIPATVSLIVDTIRLRSTFPLDLADYRIGGLTRALGLLRMDPHIEVRVDLHFIARRSASPAAP